jgi:hypothetical protein
MSTILHVEYSDKVVKYDLFKNYGIDPELQLGDKVLPKEVTLELFSKFYNFLLEKLPLEIWMKIFRIIYKEELLEYRYCIGPEMEYNLHRLFKKRKHRENYKGFDIAILASPTRYQFYQYQRGVKTRDITEYFKYYCHISHRDIEFVNQIMVHFPLCVRTKYIRDGIFPRDSYGLTLNSYSEEDFIFTHGFSPQYVLNKVCSERIKKKYTTFKTIEYYIKLCHQKIDLFYDSKKYS